MNKAKAMLDALMGPQRDVAKKDRTDDDFTKTNVCKHYLVGFCPNAALGKKLDAIRVDPAASGICPGSIYKTTVVSLDGCSLLHNKGMITQMRDHPDAEKYKKRYERDLHRFLAKIIREADNRVLDEKRKREASGKPEENDHHWVKLCEVCGMTYKLVKRKPETDSARRGMWALGDQTLRPGDWNCPKCKEINFATLDKCINCKFDRPEESKKELEEFEKDVKDSHPQTEVCLGYAHLRRKLEEFNVKYADEKDETEEKDSERRGPRDIGRNRSRSRGGRPRDGGRDGRRGERGPRDRDEKAEVWRGSPEKGKPRDVGERDAGKEGGRSDRDSKVQRATDDEDGGRKGDFIDNRSRGGGRGHRSDRGADRGPRRSASRSRNQTRGDDRYSPPSRRGGDRHNRDDDYERDRRTRRRD